MKEKLIKQLYSFITLLIVITQLGSCNELCIAQEQCDYQQAVEILKEKYGIEDFFFEKCEPSYIIEMATLATTNPEEISIVKTTNAIDNIESIENAVNLSDEELKNVCGLTDDEICALRKNLNNQRKLSDQELREKYLLTDVEIRIFREILKEKDNYRVPQINEREVTLSSTISSSYLTYYHIVTNLSGMSNVKYNVIVSFLWKKPCWNELFEDVIAVTWGGELLYDASSVSKSVSYQNAIGVYPNWVWYGDIVATKSPATDITIGEGVKFSFPQKSGVYLVNGSRIKDGLICFQIGNSSKENKSTQIVSKYCHRIISVKSASISFSNVSISVGGAYETTDDDDNVTNISY